MTPDVAAIRVVLGHELRAQLRGFAAWAVPLAGMAALVCGLQPSLANGPLAAKLASMPEAMRRAFGLELLDFQRPVAYLATNFMVITVGVALFAGLSGASIIAKEEILHTAELLYAQPVSRARVLLGKAAAVVAYVLALPLTLALVASALLAAVADRPLEPGAIAELFAGAAALACCFAGAGMLVAARAREPRSAGGITLGIVLGTYFLGMISAMSRVAAPLRWLSPFKWVEPSSIVMHGLDPLAITALLGLGAGCAAAAIRRYAGRDLHV
jgi:ABC-2 type transport system permease protein